MRKVEQKHDKKHGKKTWLWNGSIVVALLAAITVFVVMLQLEKNVLSQYEKGEIYVATAEIPEGQLITAENMTNYLELREVDASCIPTTALQNREQINGLAAENTIEAGVLLTTGMFEEVNTVTAQMKNPVIAGFKAEDMYQVVGGTLRHGDRIHIYNVSEEGFATLAWSDVFVQQVFDNAGTAISNEDTTSTAQRVNIYMDKTNVEQFYTELAKGSLRIVKVCD